MGAGTRIKHHQQHGVIWVCENTWDVWEYCGFGMVHTCTQRGTSWLADSHGPVLTEQYGPCCRVVTRHTGLARSRVHTVQSQRWMIHGARLQVHHGLRKHRALGRALPVTDSIRTKMMSPILKNISVRSSMFTFVLTACGSTTHTHSLVRQVYVYSHRCGMLGARVLQLSGPHILATRHGAGPYAHGHLQCNFACHVFCPAGCALFHLPCSACLSGRRQPVMSTAIDGPWSGAGARGACLSVRTKREA